MIWIKKLFGLEKEIDPNDFIKKSKILVQMEEERTVYLNIYGKELESLKYREIDYQTEAQVILEAFKLPELMRQTRLDAMYEDDGQFVKVEATFANPPDFKPITETWRGIEVELHPFVWHDMEIHVLGPFPDTNQLNNWFTKWFDPKDRNKKQANELHEVIHSMTHARQIPDGWTITVDFGSATMEAFLALFKQCRFHKATHIKISSETYLRKLNNAMSAQIQ
jgi:hypothetical protein